jgi:leishmanolysin-like peptidase
MLIKLTKHRWQFKINLMLGLGLGFSESNWAYFRKPDFTPYNDRAANGEPTLTAGYSCPTLIQKTVPVPRIISIFTERGQQVHKLTTPTALHFARLHFGCDTLNGLELEQQPTAPGACFGSHLEGTSLFSHFYWTCSPSFSV